MSDYFYKYVTNPVIKLGGSIFKRQSSGQSGDKVVETIIKHEYQKLEPFGFKQLPASSCFLLRVAAISGCCAVVLSSYGSHGNFRVFFQGILSSNREETIMNERDVLKLRNHRSDEE